MSKVKAALVDWRKRVLITAEKYLPLDRPFNHQAAQEYELDFAIKWTNENFERLYPDITDRDRQKQVVSEEFFENRKEWDKFVKHIEGKRCLEIGSGPAGALVRWWWAGERTIIDPLIDDYRRVQLEMYGKTWFSDDIQLLAQNAEEFVSDLDGDLDGVIVCRNALDHTSDPNMVLTNIKQYAKRGCYLLLWTDLHHIGGHNEGHRNITQDPKEFEQHIKDLGFRIDYAFTDEERTTAISYGCRAEKI